LANELASPQQRMVGIFWLVDDRLIIDASSLSEAEPYGDCLTHRNSHIDFWTGQQRLGAVPRDVEYEEHPRGRVVYNTKTQVGYLLADRCILKDPVPVATIIRALHLPVNTIVDADSHYKCPGCKKKSKEELVTEEADWGDV
jgi:hypothetical protein